MGNILIGVIIAFMISFYAIPIVIELADQVKLYDIPDERKVHKKPIPSLGGLGIFIGFMMGLLLTQSVQQQASTLQYFYASFLVVFFYGVKDDILKLLPMKKMLGQLIISIILIFKAQLVILNLYGLFGVSYIIHTFGYLLTLLTIVVVMNAYNLIDGVDGLAGTLGIITSSTFALFFYLNNDLFYALIGFVLSASLLAFLIYNFNPARIFMGDTGSMLVGLINAILVIRFITTADTSGFIPKNTSPAMGFGILAIPLLDTLRVFGYRISQGKSPFFPDRNHLHHLLLDRGFNHKQIMFTLASVAILFMLGTYLLLPLGSTLVILIQIATFFLGVFLLSKVKKIDKTSVLVEKEFVAKLADGEEGDPSGLI